MTKFQPQSQQPAPHRANGQGWELWKLAPCFGDGKTGWRWVSGPAAGATWETGQLLKYKEQGWKLVWYFSGSGHVCLFLGCGILVPQPGMGPRPMAVEVLSPNHRTLRELIPSIIFLRFIRDVACTLFQILPHVWTYRFVYPFSCRGTLGI